MIKILIIEDDPIVLRVYNRIFSLEGFSVELAEGGEEGLVKAKSTNPSLILLDIMMPNKNGVDVLDELKADVDTKKIPVVVLTNLSGEKNAETVLASGAIKFITKSDHEPEEVVEIVKQVLEDLAAKDTNS